MSHRYRRPERNAAANERLVDSYLRTGAAATRLLWPSRPRRPIDLPRHELMTVSVIEIAKVPAFGIAVLVGTPEILGESPDGILGISRQQLRQAGNLAWHMLQTRGRESPSTTSRLMIIQSDE